MQRLAVEAASDLLARNIPRQPLICSYDLLDAGGRLLLAGDPGIGKSYAALQAAYEASQGIPILGSYEVGKPLRVLYLQVEVADFELQRRTRRMERALGPTDGLFVASPPDLTLASAEEELTAVVGELGIELLVLDPFYALHEGGEIQLEAVRPTLRVVNRIIRPGLGCIMVVHLRKEQIMHDGRPARRTEDDISGHRSLVNWADTIGILTKRGQVGLQLEWAKVRNHPGKPPSLNLVWTDVLPLAPEGSSYAQARDAGPKVAVMRLLARGPQPQGAVMKATGLGETAARRLVNALMAEGLVEIETAGRGRQPTRLRLREENK